MWGNAAKGEEEGTERRSNSEGEGGDATVWEKEK